MPDFQFGAREDMYFRPCSSTAVRNLVSQQRIEFGKGGLATFDTFFNALTIHTWKKHCTLDDLYLVLNGRGRFSVRFGLHRLGRAQCWLEEKIVDLDGPAAIKVDSWGTLESGLLYFSLKALEDDAYIAGGRFATSARPNPAVKIGIVITHFNRKRYVLPAIRRIRDELLADQDYRSKLELIVVDNSQNITAEEAAGITLIPNRNLGGSGGFTRGLLHLMDEGSFTHCLFMDDDASCEIESIRRAHDFLSFTRPGENIAVSGSLLRELYPCLLHEKGGRFNGYWQAIAQGLDMSHVHGLLQAEADDVRPNYGAWWFFAFPLMGVRHFPFPFFVRGDDVLFSLQNGFNIVTMNGIGCWGEDFDIKENALSRYLDYRATVLVSIMMGCASRKSMLMMFARRCLAPLFSYNYATANAVCWSLRDVLKGPQFFVDNLDTAAIRKRIGEIAPEEAMKPIERADYLPDHHSSLITESRLRRLVRLVTINGLLLPGFMMKNGIVFQPKASHAIFRQIFRYRRVYYEHEYSGMGYVASHGKRRLFAGLCRFSATCWALLTRFNRVQKQYIHQKQHLTSETFWRDIYK